MQLILPLILIAAGGAGIVALRDQRGVALALLVQWIGITGLVIGLFPLGGWERFVVVEGVTALVCGGLLTWTVWTLHNIRVDEMPGLREEHRSRWLHVQARHSPITLQEVISDRLLQLAIVVSGGIAGFGLAQIYPLGGSMEALLAFYWVVLSAVLALVLHGARDPIKQAAGLIALLNGVALLLETVGLQAPATQTIGLLSLCRVALAGLFSYLAITLKANFLDVDLSDLFDARSGIVPGEYALVLASDESYLDAYPDEEVDLEEEIVPDTLEESGDERDEVIASGQDSGSKEARHE